MKRLVLAALFLLTGAQAHSMDLSGEAPSTKVFVQEPQYSVSCYQQMGIRGLVVTCVYTALIGKSVYDMTDYKCHIFTYAPLTVNCYPLLPIMIDKDVQRGTYKKQPTIDEVEQH